MTRIRKTTRREQTRRERRSPDLPNGAQPSTLSPELLKESATAVGLRYVADHMPGICRKRAGRSFQYFYATGEPVRDDVVLGRIRSLAVPPAWADVWICPDPQGHLQATGRDQRRRKQFRYHKRWHEIRDETKFTRMIAFGKALPLIRKRVQQDLELRGLPRNRVLATVVRLLELSLIRVGNDEYARYNESYGLTTLRNKHVQIEGSTLKFRFRGKSKVWHEVGIQDRRIARIVERCQDLPGQELFEYFDDDDRRQDVKSSDVNDYLKEITGQDFTAKDFRTWAGTVLASMALKELKEFDTKAQAKKNLVNAIEAVSKRLGNTPSICRKCYVHPDVINAYMDGTLKAMLARKAEKEAATRLPPEEAAVLALLQRQLKKSSEPLAETLTRAIRKETAKGKVRR